MQAEVFCSSVGSVIPTLSAVIARSDSDEAIPVGEARMRECLGYGDCRGREKRGLAMTVMLK